MSARVDAYCDDRGKGATVAIEQRADIVKKMVTAQEPPPAKMAKALPAPDMNTRKKRGGKRMRLMKEKYAVSETRKAANRMGFGELGEDVFQDEMGPELGSLGTKGGTGLRATEQGKKKSGTITKKMAQRLAAEKNRQGFASSIRAGDGAGTASVAFTPVQGLEITRVQTAQVTGGKYFGAGKGFKEAAGKRKRED